MSGREMALKAFRETKANHRQLEWNQNSHSGRGKLRDNGEKPKALRRDDVQPKIIYLGEVSAGWKDTIMSLGLWSEPRNKTKQTPSSWNSHQQSLCAPTWGTSWKSKGLSLPQETWMWIKKGTWGRFQRQKRGLQVSKGLQWSQPRSKALRKAVGI